MTWHNLRRPWISLDRAAGGLAADTTLYAGCGAFALATAAWSTLPAHRAWGAVAVTGYGVAALLAAGQWAAHTQIRYADRRSPVARFTGTAARAWLTAFTWLATAIVPLLAQSVQRAGGRGGRAQEEVIVVERSATRLLDSGTPYLARDAIAALPEADRLLGYTPYQPGMALFGLPRALAGAVWWTDTRIWFALVTAIVIAAALHVARRADPGGDQNRRRDHSLVRAAQFATVLPISALTLATGGDDLPVLALTLLALALCLRRGPADATGYGRAGLAVGAAAALKLFAWPVAAVLVVHAARRGHTAGVRMAAAALGLPVAALLPALLVDPSALVENVVRFPSGAGLVVSPAASPLPGWLIANALPAGRSVAVVLLVAAALGIAVWLLRRPPVTAASATLFCGYGLTAAILLMPASRFGYLLYPAALLAWAPALRLAEPQAPIPAVRPAIGARSAYT